LNRCRLNYYYMGGGEKQAWELMVFYFKLGALTTQMQLPSTPSDDHGRGRGRGKSRGGLGKYLRARGRGRGTGRPAEFTKRLVLGEEGKPDLTEEETAELEKELREKYGRRKLGTNEDRYKEEEVELDSDGVSRCFTATP